MAKYFSKFPTLKYPSLFDDGSVDYLTNIISRYALGEGIRDNLSFYVNYDIRDGETPEMIAHKVYDSAERHWLVLLANDIIDVQEQWPLTYDQLNNYINEKYFDNGDGTELGGLRWAANNVYAYYKTETVTTSKNVVTKTKVQVDANTYANISLTSYATVITGGTLWGIGESYYTIGLETAKSSPVQLFYASSNWKQIRGPASGYDFVGAIKTDGTLWMWGENAYGQLGDNTRTARSSPIQTVAGGSNWKQLDIGYSHVAAIKTDGTLWMWGENNNGQLGTNNTNDSSSPVQTVTGGTNWKQVSCGTNHFTAAIKTDGTLWMWGRNFYGTLGDNTTISRSSPVQTVATGNNWSQVSCGYVHTAAIKTDGTLWVWGDSPYGQLGNNTTGNGVYGNNVRSSPVQTVAAGTNWSQVSCGHDYTGAIKTDGTLWLWGDNGYGELGDNTTVTRSSPVQTVAGGTNWKQIDCGDGHTAAIKTDGTLWLWGKNADGELGTNNQTSRSSPVQTVATGNNWSQVSVGQTYNRIYTFAISAITQNVGTDISCTNLTLSDNNTVKICLGKETSSYYEYEYDENESKRKIRLLNFQYIDRVEDELKRVFDDTYTNLT